MKIRVNPHTVDIVREQTEPINEREINVSKCEFEFDEAITSEFVKEAYFTLNGNTYKMMSVIILAKFLRKKELWKLVLLLLRLRMARK